jgi:hypothetical protein
MFHDKHKLMELMTTNQLHNVLRWILHIEEEDKHNNENMGKNTSQ